MKSLIYDESAIFLENPEFKTSKFSFNIEEKYIDIKNENMKEKSNLDKGKYYIINSPNFHNLGIKVFNETKKVFLSSLNKMLKSLNFNDESKVMIVGLGNLRILSDSLGFEVFSNIVMTKGLKEFKNFREVMGIAPDIYAKTGIESFDITNEIVKLLKPDFVIVIDSLATNEIERLGVSFQITNSTLKAGSALSSENKTFSKKNLKTNCIFIGVPLLFKYDDKFLTISDIDMKIKKCSKIIYDSLNEVLHPYFNEKEIKELL